MSRPTGIFPGGNVFQIPPPAVEASELSAATDDAGEAARGAAATGVAAAMTGGVAAIGARAAGDFSGGGHGTACGGFCAITGETGELAGAGVGVTFLFFASFPSFGVAVGFGGGLGDTAATFGTSICWAGSTRINAFSAGGGGVGASPATTALCRLGETRSR